MTKKNSDFRKILVCIDGSKHSELALSKAIFIAEKYKSKLLLLTVIEESLFDFWNETEYAVGLKRPQFHPKEDSKTWRHGRKILEKFSKKIPSKIEFGEKILVGDIANEIINYSKKEKIDLIILGARGIGGFVKLLLGSISSKVSGHAPCSILIIRDQS